MHTIGNTHDNQKQTIQNLSYVCMFIWFQVLRILLKYIIFFQNTYSQSNKHSHTHIQTNALTQTLSINDIYIFK